MIIGFSSILLAKPLLRDYPAGTKISRIQAPEAGVQDLGCSDSREGNALTVEDMDEHLNSSEEKTASTLPPKPGPGEPGQYAELSLRPINEVQPVPQPALSEEEALVAKLD